MLTEAALALEQNNRSAATAKYREIVDDKGLPQVYRDAGTIRLTALEFDTLKPEQVIARLETLAKAAAVDNRLLAFGNVMHDWAQLGCSALMVDPSRSATEGTLMARNLDRRVEALCPIPDRMAALQIEQLVLPALLRDTTRAHVLGADGKYTLAEPDPDQVSIDSQDSLLEWYAAEQRIREGGSGR